MVLLPYYYSVRSLYLKVLLVEEVNSDNIAILLVWLSLVVCYYPMPLPVVVVFPATLFCLPLDIYRANYWETYELSWLVVLLSATRGCEWPADHPRYHRAPHPVSFSSLIATFIQNNTRIVTLAQETGLVVYFLLFCLLLVRTGFVIPVGYFRSRRPQSL